MTFVEFSSATDAVNCAINIHKDFKKANAQTFDSWCDCPPETVDVNVKIYN